jgi:hypothetical protein
MTLAEAVGRLSEFDADDTIYAAEPWTVDSNVIVAAEPPSGGLPDEAAEHGLKYFLEISVASDFLEDWKNSLRDNPTTPAICQRLIAYAVNDA